jgi:hypothetical protein
MHGLATRNLEKAGANPRALFQHVSGWWKTVGRFDREWVIGSWLGLLAFAGAWGIYAASRGRVENYVAELSRLLTLQSRGHPDPVALAQAAHETVGFSLSQVGWAVLFFSLGVGGLILITSGYFAGKRAVIAGGFLCALMAVDLGWQDREWVRTWNWKEKYVETTDNPVFDFLRQKPYEHRVASLPRWVTALYRLDPQLVAALSEFQQVYDIEWTQHLFLFHDIQSLDIIQMPRRPVEVEAFEQTFHFDYTTNAQFLATRRWQLTNTRYLLGTAPLVQLLNQAFDPVQQRFRALMLFEIYQNAPGGPILTRTNDVGPYALMEFSGALPRAKLYTHWETVPYDAATVNSWLAEKRSKLPPFMTSAFSQISTNDLAALQRLADRNFDPDQTVLLSEPLATALSTNATPGTVQFVSYSPKHLRLKSNASSPTVLLLNDKYDPGWRVTVDGAPAQLLRCNYVMRGVYLPTPGEHTIEFVFERPRMPLYVSVAGVAFGILLLVFVNVKR